MTFTWAVLSLSKASMTFKFKNLKINGRIAPRRCERQITTITTIRRGGGGRANSNETKIYLQKSVDTANRKLQTSFHGTWSRLTLVSLFRRHRPLGTLAGETLARKSFRSFAWHFKSTTSFLSVWVKWGSSSRDGECRSSHGGRVVCWGRSKTVLFFLDKRNELCYSPEGVT